jgi:hypothetical protein
LIEYSDKYPIKNKREYLQSVGRLSPHRIGQILKELNLIEDYGYRVWINPNQGNDVDLKVWYNNSLILVGEILNWSAKSWLSKKRKSWIIKNLLEYDCLRILIYTTFSNENLLEDLSLNGFSLLKIGYQLLPKSYYDFFAGKNEVENRERDSQVTRQDIKSKIIHHLQSFNGEILTSIFEQIVE